MKSTPCRTISSLRLSSFSPADLEKLSRAVQCFDIENVRFTPGGQIAVTGLADDDIAGFTGLLEQFMQPIPENAIGALLACPGCTTCKHGRYDTAALAEKIEKLELPLPLPAKVKIAVAGCARCCTMPRLRDIGLVPGMHGYHLYFGGNGGAKPRISDCIGKNLSVDELLSIIQLALTVYRQQAQPGMRTSRFIEQIGIDVFRKKLKKKVLP